MEGLKQSSSSLSLPDDSLRNSSSSTDAEIRKNLPPSRLKMMPIQRRELSGTKDDERDDAFVGSKPRVDWRWSHRGTNSKISSHERVSLTGAPNRGIIQRGYAPPRPRGPPIWNQSSGWQSSRDTETYRWPSRPQHPVGMVPLSHSGTNESTSMNLLPFSHPVSDRSLRSKYRNHNYTEMSTSSNARFRRGERSSALMQKPSRAVIPNSLILPKELVPIGITDEQTSETLKKRRVSNGIASVAKRARRFEPLEGQFDKLDLLCSATLELGPLQENPAGCSCPKSKCIALYCDCFKAGRRCSQSCSCLECRNTIKESGANGARSKVCIGL